MASEKNSGNEKAPAPKVQKKKSEKSLAAAGARVTRWFREMRSELKKVVWPTRKQTVNNSAVAIVVIIAAAIVVWGFDQISMLVVNTLISIGG